MCLTVPATCHRQSHPASVPLLCDEACFATGFFQESTDGVCFAKPTAPNGCSRDVSFLDDCLIGVTRPFSKEKSSNAKETTYNNAQSVQSRTGLLENVEGICMSPMRIRKAHAKGIEQMIGFSFLSVSSSDG